MSREATYRNGVLEDLEFLQADWRDLRREAPHSLLDLYEQGRHTQRAAACKGLTNNEGQAWPFAGAIPSLFTVLSRCLLPPDLLLTPLTLILHFIS